MFQILDVLSESVYISDMETYQLLYMNKACKTLFSLSDKTPYSGKCYKILHGLNEPCKNCTNQLLKQGEVYERELSSRDACRHFLLKDKIILWEGKTKARMEIILDITEQKNEMKELEKMTDIENFIISCLKILHSKNTFQENIESLLKEAGLFLGSNRTYMFDFDHENQIMNNTFEWCNDGTEPAKDLLQNLPMSIIPNWIEHFSKNEYVYIPDVEKLDNTTQEYKTLAKQNIKSLLAVALQTEKGELLGFFGVDDPSPLQSYKHIQFLLNTLSFFITSMTEQQKIKEKLVTQSYTDALTGLQNRNRFTKDSIRLQEKECKNIGIAFVDMNGLKTLNDEYGHERGDQALKGLADILGSFFRKKDLYRVGGDEFVILCAGISERVFHEKMEQLLQLAKKEDTQPFAVGFKWYEAITDINSQLKEADDLMYDNKREYYRDKNSHYCPCN